MLLLLPIAAPVFPLTIESIMRGPALVGHAPRSVRWSPDGSKIGFSWAKADGTEDPTYKPYTVNRDGTGLAPGALPNATTTTNPWDRGSKVGALVVYEENGDIVLRDTSKNSSEKLTETTERESNPILTKDGSLVVFLRNGNLYRLTIAGKKVDQLTETQATEKPTGAPAIPVRIVTEAGFRNGSLNPTPAGTHATLDMLKAATGSKPSQVPNYITGSGYAELIPTSPKVGGPQSENKIAVYNLTTGTKFDIAPPRPGRVSRLQWSPDGRYGIAWAFAEDHKDAWILGFDTATDKVETLWTEHDDAWVGGPGLGTLGWIPDTPRFYFQSEKNGFCNLLTMSPGDTTPQNLTEGPFEVTDVMLDNERSRFVFVSSEGSPFERHIDSVSFYGGLRRKLADYSADEDATFAMSPDGKEFAVVRSKSNRPAELYVNSVQVTNSPTEEWLAGPWIDPPIVMVPSRDGVQIPARLYKPKRWRKGGPAVLFVHGAGYLQNVYNGWSHYFREYMFHHFLMDRGYAVLDMDYRASAGYGKAWRTGIYRHMGGKDLNDIVDGANWMVKTQGVAPDRLGVYGGSYGGFITFMAMFTTPDVFKAGAALRPVGDWKTYNHGYTSNILNTPQLDEEAYKRSSPINFVEGLKGHLLICHGMVDVNVQFQDSVRIVQRLIEQGKTNWSVAPYPVEDHAFTKPSSWTDEYRRIFDLFENTIGNKRR